MISGFSADSASYDRPGGRGARRQVLDHDIGLFGDQALQDGPRFRVLDVERQAPWSGWSRRNGMPEPLTRSS